MGDTYSDIGYVGKGDGVAGSSSGGAGGGLVGKGWKVDRKEIG